MEKKSFIHVLTFGFRYEGKYIQSCCNRCRGLKGVPSTPFENYTLRHADDKIIPEIRALPLGKNEFENIKDCIHFLTKEMPPRGNIFYYRAHSMVTVPGSLILFQYDGKIIAYGFFENEKKLSEAQDKLYLEQGYTGYYKFEEDSIQILSTPITNKEMQNNFNVSLGQGTTKISVNYLPKLMEFFNIKSEYIKSIEEEPIDIQQKTLQFIFSRHLFFVEFFLIISAKILLSIKHLAFWFVFLTLFKNKSKPFQKNNSKNTHCIFFCDKKIKR